MWTDLQKLPKTPDLTRYLDVKGVVALKNPNIFLEEDFVGFQSHPHVVGLWDPNVWDAMVSTSDTVSGFNGSRVWIGLDFLWFGMFSMQELWFHMPRYSMLYCLFTYPKNQLGASKKEWLCFFASGSFVGSRVAGGWLILRVRYPGFGSGT